MIIKDEKANVECKILGYQFVDCKPSKKNDFNYDANWLTLEINYQKDNCCNTYRDSCLLTYELEDTIHDIQNILSGKQTAFVSEYMEPYLKLAVSKVDNKFSVILFFVYDTVDGEWQTFTVTETVSREYLSTIKDEMQNYLKQYPKR